jgi:hypothetical protein
MTRESPLKAIETDDIPALAMPLQKLMLVDHQGRRAPVVSGFFEEALSLLRLFRADFEVRRAVMACRFAILACKPSMRRE